jgi:hypothetical protein
MLLGGQTGMGLGSVLAVNGATGVILVTEPSVVRTGNPGRLPVRARRLKRKAQPAAACGPRTPFYSLTKHFRTSRLPKRYRIRKSGSFWQNLAAVQPKHQMCSSQTRIFLSSSCAAARTFTPTLFCDRTRRTALSLRIPR